MDRPAFWRDRIPSPMPYRLVRHDRSVDLTSKNYSTNHGDFRHLPSPALVRTCTRKDSFGLGN
jgi:hypothetical protein